MSASSRPCPTCGAPQLLLTRGCTCPPPAATQVHAERQKHLQKKVLEMLLMQGALADESVEALTAILQDPERLSKILPVADDRLPCRGGTFLQPVRLGPRCKKCGGRGEEVSSGAEFGYRVCGRAV